MESRLSALEKENKHLKETLKEKEIMMEVMDAKITNLYQKFDDITKHKTINKLEKK